MRKATELSLTDQELTDLRAWGENRQDRAVRVAIVRDAAEGLSVSESARQLGVSRPTVTAWRQRYLAHGVAGLEHRPRSGRPARIDEADVVAATLAGPPPPQKTWSARALAGHLGISHTSLGSVWQRWRIRHGVPDLPVVPPLDPPLECRQPELLAAWAQSGGAGFLIVAQAALSGQPRTKPATAEERRMRYAALDTVMRRVQPAHADIADEPCGESALSGRTFGAPAGAPGLVLPPATAARWAGRRLHIVTWGGAAPAGLPADSVVHPATASMSWAATVCLMAQLELAHQPQAARVAFDSLADAAGEQSRGPCGTPFLWLRQDPQGAAPRRRATHRAFDPPALGSFHEKAVAESVRAAGSLSRTEIAERTGLTPQAVSRTTRNLLTAGILVADESRQVGTGKPRVPLRLRPDAACAVGIHVDPEQLTHVLVDLCGTDRARHTLAVTPHSDPRSCLEWMRETTSRTVAEAGPLGRNLLGVGVAVPGPLDVREGVVDPPLWAGWDEVPLRHELNRMLGLPVLLEKDATAAAIGEQWLGAGESSTDESATDFVYLYLGSGAGSGAFLNGQVFRGASGNAGEFGELTAYALGHATPDGGPKTVPECAPMSAAVARAAQAGLGGPDGGLSYDAVCAAAARGNRRAAGAIREVARVVARGAVALTDLYDTDLMIVGGPAVPPEVAELYLTEISTAVNQFPIARRVRPVRVTYSTLSTTAAAVGAAVGVFQKAFAARPPSPGGAST